MDEYPLPSNDKNPGARQMSEELYREGLLLLAKRRFADARDRFDDSLQLDRRNSDCYSKMGVAALYQDDLVEAKRYFERALQLDRDKVEAMNGLSYIDLREGRNADAADRLCDVLKLDSGNRFAKYNFNLIKETENLETIPPKIHPNQFVALPRKRFIKKRNKDYKIIRVVAVSVIFLSLAVLLYTLYKNDMLKLLFARQRNALQTVDKDKYDYFYPVSKPLTAELKKSYSRAMAKTDNDDGPVLSLSEATMLITRAKQLHNNREYNEARYVLNKIKSSKVDPSSYKDAVELSKFNRDPDYDKLKFNPSAGKVVKEPRYYKKLTVKWLAKTISDSDAGVLQLTPSRYQADGVGGIRVVVLGRELPKLKKGRQVEIFGKILGVDNSYTNTGSNIFLFKRNIKILH